MPTVRNCQQLLESKHKTKVNLYRRALQKSVCLLAWLQSHQRTGSVVAGSKHHTQLLLQTDHLNISSLPKRT